MNNNIYKLRLTNECVKLSDAGFSIIPLKQESKVAIGEWKTYQNELAEWDQITKWIDDHPNMNIGVVTGIISNIIVVDCDSETSYQYLINKGIGSPAIAKTGKGYHLYYQYPEAGCRNRTGFLPDTDLRGDGGYVVTPPSRHENGSSYSWISHPDEGIGQMPDWLLEAATKPNQPLAVDFR